MPLYRAGAGNDTINSEVVVNSLTTTSSILVPANPSTTTVVIINRSELTAYIGTRETVSASDNLIDLKGNGDYYEVPGGYNKDVWAVLATGTGSLDVERFFKV